jgi:hypothetical protein
MRKLLTLENIPAAKSEVVKEVAKTLGKTAFWTFVSYVTICAGLVAVGLSEEKKKQEETLKEEK